MISHVKRRVGAIALAVTLLLGSPAASAVVVLTSTIDLADSTSFNDQFFSWDPEQFGPLSVTLAEGDTLDWTIRLLPGQSITLTDPLAIAARLPMPSVPEPF